MCPYGFGSVANWTNPSLFWKVWSKALCTALFNNVIQTVIKNIHPFLIEPYVYVSHLCYVDNILLLSDDLQALQNAVRTVCSGLDEIGLQVACSKTELLVSGSSQQTSVTINVGPKTISASSSLNYLGLPFGSGVKTNEKLFISTLK